MRLARVRATLADARDHLQYEYWTGKEYRRPDPKDEYALARLNDPAADLIHGNAQQNTRPEISVSYNPYVDRFLLLDAAYDGMSDSLAMGLTLALPLIYLAISSAVLECLSRVREDEARSELAAE